MYKTDLPVTKTDAKLRLKHTKQSIDYNLMHLHDHLNGVKTSLTKMATVHQPAAVAAHTQAKAKVATELQKFDGPFHKSLGKVKSAPATVSGGLASYLSKKKPVKA